MTTRLLLASVRRSDAHGQNLADELRDYLKGGCAALAAQSYDPKGSASVPEHDGFSDRQLPLTSAHRRVWEALSRVSSVHRLVLRLSYAALEHRAKDDQFPGDGIDLEIAPLLRHTRTVASVAVHRWEVAEREALAGRRWVTAPDDEVEPDRATDEEAWLKYHAWYGAMKSARWVKNGGGGTPVERTPSPSDVRGLATRIIHEGKQPMMTDALTEARQMLADAETAYVVAYRAAERERAATREAESKRERAEENARRMGVEDAFATPHTCRASGSCCR